MLTLLPEIGTLERKQVASLAGLAPITRQSGKWQGKAFIRGGRKLLRDALYMPALVAMRYNPDLKAKYDDLRAVGKPAKVAKELPVDQRSQFYQFMTHVDQIHEARAQQIFLFRGAITVLHGQTNLQGFQRDTIKHCRKRLPKSPLNHSLTTAWGLFRADEVEFSRQDV